MKEIKLFKTLLIPSLGVLTLGTIAAVATNCGRSPQPTSTTVVVTANANSTLGLHHNGGNNPNLQYSTDRTSWNTYSEEISISQGQTLYLKGNNPEGWSTGMTTYSNFEITGDVSLSGNIMTLIDNGRETATAAIPNNYCFYSLFKGSTGITSVSKDFLPATNLAQDCYVSMFNGCASLTQAPDLPATNLAQDCYVSMFNGCTSLTQAPDLPATNLAQDCYVSMFTGCTSLTQAPDLPATELGEGCYYYMFHDCASLTTAPELPATNLARDCYSRMFTGCTSLTQAPDLPATELAENCYKSMFNGCSSLNSIRIGYTGNYNSTYFGGWVYRVANTGTFYYNGNDTVENFGFPNGWSINPN